MGPTLLCCPFLIEIFSIYFFFIWSKTRNNMVVVSPKLVFYFGSNFYVWGCLLECSICVVHKSRSLLVVSDVVYSYVELLWTSPIPHPYTTPNIEVRPGLEKVVNGENCPYGQISWGTILVKSCVTFSWSIKALSWPWCFTKLHIFFLLSKLEFLINYFMQNRPEWTPKSQIFFLLWFRVNPPNFIKGFKKLKKSSAKSRILIKSKTKAYKIVIYHKKHLLKPMHMYTCMSRKCVRSQKNVQPHDKICTCT